MKISTGFYPPTTVDGARSVAQALRSPRPGQRRDGPHALSLAIGGDCLSNIAMMREEPAVFGKVASDPTVSRLIDTLAADVPVALAAIEAARASARANAWRLAGADAPDHDATAAQPLVVGLDATLVTAHSDKELAAPTFKRGHGHHPLLAYLDHGAQGTGEPLACQLR